MGAARSSTRRRWSCLRGGGLGGGVWCLARQRKRAHTAVVLHIVLPLAVTLRVTAIAHPHAMAVSLAARGSPFYHSPSYV